MVANANSTWFSVGILLFIFDWYMAINYVARYRYQLDIAGIIIVFLGFYLIPEQHRVQLMYLLGLVSLLKEWTKE